MASSSYEQFGAAFFVRAVTSERVAATVARVAGEVIEVGPLKVGPGGLATAQATGKVGSIIAAQTSVDPISHRVEIPVDISLEVVLAATPYRFTGTMTLTLQITARAITDPLQVLIDIDPLRRQDVALHMRADGLQARILKRLGNMDEEIRDQVVKTVGALLEAPKAQEVRIIDVGKLIDEVWE
jgi:hypothetical protein